PVPHAHLRDWFRAADWTVLTSRSEGVPNVLLESHACGTPFIATRVGGVPEITVAGIDRTAAPLDHDEFAAQMELALTSPAADATQLSASVSGLDDTATKMVGIIRGVSDLNSGEFSYNRGILAPPAERRNPCRQIARRVLSAVLPRQLFLTGGPPQCRQICLTFDDGPHPEHTPRLLDVLDELGIKATFFVIGRNAERYPHIVQRIAHDGHVLGNHTWSHPALANLSPNELTHQVSRTGELLKQITGTESRLFRPPQGKLRARQFVALWGMQQTVVLWNSDPKDYQCLDGNELLRNLRGQNLQNGSLILLHDNHPFAAQVMTALAARAQANGLTFATVDQWTETAAKSKMLPGSATLQFDTDLKIGSRRI
ncbi:MAG TPA: polysaccharide deacetylase family protein, partial [Planctomycetaceae bacterium]